MLSSPQILSASKLLRIDDIEIEEDLIEEIARVNGYNHLKTDSIISKIVSKPYKNPFYYQDKVRDSFLNRNFNEILNLSFNSDSDIKILKV